MGEIEDLTDKIIAYEEGSMDEEAMVAFFQELIDNGLAWKLQGSYGRQAASLIEAGHCHLRDLKKKEGT